MSVWLIGLILLSTIASGLTVRPDQRIVATGDLHGDLDNTLRILQFTGLVNSDATWTAGDTIWGDVVDRGVDTIPLYKLIQRLRAEAAAAGGAVVSTLGNHEVMNMIGDWRYVHPSDIASFGGTAARAEAFSPEGWIGEELLQWNVTAVVGSSLFCHGGVHFGYATPHGTKINDEAKRILPDYIASHGSHHHDPYGVFGSQGPTWYRGYALDSEDEVCPLLEKALKELQVDRMVMGHTVQRDGHIRTRCGGRAILIDIGISHVYGGYPGALEIMGDQIAAIYDNGRRELLTPTGQNTRHDEL
ncbi:Metallo-dependent phosphatase-like protein [Syncephalastrum racemosum]|uniref:Metallo-dependent phosphatase-like protein n=1 Tax=Syncephalastrum racemosum TaxID=13706 RepID=A0A1X2H0Q3_SYNRA|nr:Metallo-dependent phosphatase-like protein [Syncephalastrum racemosum]